MEQNAASSSVSTPNVASKATTMHTTDAHTSNTVTVLTGAKAWEAEGNQIIGGQHTRQSLLQYNYNCESWVNL